jgi:hypothetical protein
VKSIDWHYSTSRCYEVHLFETFENVATERDLILVTKQQLEIEKQQLEIEKQQLEIEKQQLEIEKNKRDAKLRELGIDPDTL